VADIAVQLRDALRDRYLLERELGRGGMATVYLARDLKHDRLVALKVLHPELAATLGPERFLREIHTAARLQHPHILTVLDSGEASGLLWYTMPYVEGESLRQWLTREHALPVADALRIAAEVAQGLDHAHRHGVVHRDVKPENVLISDGQALLADFGVACALADAGGRLTETGLALGTPAYMSPEQATGARELDGRSDVYALGCVLYEMLAGEPPFTGPTAQSIIAKRLRESAPAVRRVRPTVSEEVERAVEIALASNPADRFQSAGEFASALQRLPSSHAEPAQQVSRWASRRRLALVGVLLLAIIGAAAYGLSRHTPSPRTAQTPAGAVPAPSPPGSSSAPSVAILPFINMSPDRENEYFSDGMTEELITALSKIDGLRVAARTSAFAFKGTNADIKDIGARLHVGTVVEGSVRRAGKRLRVTAQLINVGDGYHLWSEEYDRELKDVFAMQDDLARAIVGALRPHLGLPGQAATIVKTATVDPEAHDLYLRGRFFWNQRTADALRTAVRYFDRAIARDSAYAEAYAALAETYVLFPNYYVSVPALGYPKAKRAALRALALDSTLGYAYATLGVVQEAYEWDWRGAERDFRRAITLDPNYATAHQWYAEYLSSLGRHREAHAEADRSVTLDPLSSVIRVDKAGVLIRGRRYDEAIAELRATLDMDPSFVPAHNYLGWAYLAKGMLAEAVAQQDTTVRMTGRTFGMGRLACAYALSGQRDSALRVLRELTDRSQREYVASFQFALAYLGLGDRDQALDWLEKSAELHEPSLFFSIRTDPLFDSLRADPRFQRLLVRMGLK
jgi:serine/threonine protein kinase/tetratricopeptide (TPR) repeat protein